MKSRAPLFGALFAVLAAVLFWFFAYSPKVEEQELVEAETAQLETEAQTLRNEIARLEDIESRQVEIRAQLTRLEELIPEGAAQPAFINELQRVADESGVEILSATFGAPAPIVDAPATGDEGTVLAQVSVSVVVEGGYYQAVDLFRRLEGELDRALLVGAFQMAEGELKFPSLSTTWNGSLFTVVPVAMEPAPAPEPSPAPGEDGEPAPTDGASPAPEGEATEAPDTLTQTDTTDATAEGSS